MPADVRPTLIKLCETLRDLRDKESAVLAEIETILNDGEGIGAKLKRVKAAWCEVWSARHKEPCDFDHVKHTAFLKAKLLKASEEVIIAKFHSYLANDEAYYVRARHPFGLFRTNYDTWRGLPETTASADATERLRELRGV